MQSMDGSLNNGGKTKVKTNIFVVIRYQCRSIQDGMSVRFKTDPVRESINYSMV